MLKRIVLALPTDVQVTESALVENKWRISARLQQQSGICPDCHLRSVSRHGWHRRGLVDLPAMGREVVLNLQVSRWRCCSATCARQTFVAPHPVLFRLHGRRARRAEQIVRLIGHSVGGRPGERLLGVLV
jgi:transposase